MIFPKKQPEIGRPGGLTLRAKVILVTWTLCTVWLNLSWAVDARQPAAGSEGEPSSRASAEGRQRPDKLSTTFEVIARDSVSHHQAIADLMNLPRS